MAFGIDMTVYQNIENKLLPQKLAETEASLASTEAKFNVIFNHSLDVILVIDGQDGKILDVNQTVSRVLGYQPEALIGQHFSLFLPPLIQEMDLDEWLEKLRIHGIAFEGQLFYKADGSTCPMDLTVTMVPWCNRTAILATLRDATDRTLAETAQHKLIRELNAFAHTVAHDLKAPLGVIIGAGEVLNEFSSLTAREAQELTDLIMRNGNKMGNIIEELLLLAQIRDEDVEVDELEMAGIITEAQQRLFFKIQERQAEIKLPEQWPVAIGYAPWVEEVWVNYISNALKYGGTPPVIELGAVETADDMIRFWISDNGLGLGVEQQKKLFTQFTRLADVRAEGYGLGLSIVRRIVEKLGGEVGVESRPNQGCVFSFTLPKPS
ncbi:MAG: PAS domain S-box protein [Anaerolineae bacterium]|nr:PAS domain S-box protein [Anaerolineae bacterium]